MSDSPSNDLVAKFVTRSRVLGGVALAASACCAVAGYLIDPGLLGGAVSSTAAPILTVLATLSGTAGLMVLFRAPKLLPATQLVVLAAAVSVLAALAPLDRIAANDTIASFLLVAPWRYALTPLVVHFAFAIGWSHRAKGWTGLITGWYLLHGALLVAATGGIVTDEGPLLAAVDETFRARILEPAGLVVALVALSLALASAERQRARRRAIIWALLGVVIGAMPIVVASLFPVLDLVSLGTATPSHLALVALPILGLGAVLVLPFNDPVARDLAAYQAAQQVLDAPELTAGLRDLAELLRSTLEAQSVVVRLSRPAITATAGTPRSAPSEGQVWADAETLDEGRIVVAPIGRGGDPLGDVRVEGRFQHAFTADERDWLVAFLVPLASVIRTRWREVDGEQRSMALKQRAREAADDLAKASDTLPSRFTDDGMAVPPTVDAREVLSQLGEGVTNVARQGDALGSVANDVREHTRHASDAIARALDAIAIMGTELGRVIQRGDEIAANNDTVSGVAFRTNLLANNAALEATRAGTAGQTFGVLAGEIGRLADTTAGTSTAIATQTTALTEEIALLQGTIAEVRSALETAIREAESGETGARHLVESASSVEATSRSLRPTVEEANLVAKRRSARDQHLTATLERFLHERMTTTRTLVSHRDTLEKLVQALRRLEDSSNTPPGAIKARERR